MSSFETFRVATFNVNGIRARLPLVMRWLTENRPDCLCLQETKVQDHDFPKAPFEEIGLNVIFRGQKAYNGVAIISPHPIEEVHFGFGDEEDSAEDCARLVRCVIQGIAIVNSYVPQGKSIDHPDYRRKLTWLSRLRRLFQRTYDPSSRLLWCGDINVAPTPLDLYAPERKEDHVCFQHEAREALESVLAWGFEDLFRKFHPGESGHYTFFDYRIPKALERGLGWRIDHIFVTPPLSGSALDCRIDIEPRKWSKPSDHTVLFADFSL